MAVPPQVPLVKFFSPERSDQGLIEFWSAEIASYQPLDVGTPHPNTREYSGFKLAKQQNLPNDQRFVLRIWVKDDTNPLWFAYQIKYLGDANAYPVFIRHFRELRKTYAPLTKGQPLKAVYQLKKTTGGSGYTVGTEPTVTFSGGGGSGAEGHAIVAPDGTIADLILDEAGAGYTSAPSITIEAPPTGGTTATGTAVIQPATALLTAEEAHEFPEDSEFYGLYFDVVRVYETLPGPTIPYTRFDDNLGPVQGTRQAVLYANQAAALTATGKTTYEARDGSSIVAWKIVETWSDGEGTESNPAYPIGVTDFYDNERGAVHQTSQLTTDLTSPGSLTVSGGTATRIRYEPFPENPALRKKIIETWAVPGPVQTFTEFEKDGVKKVVTRQLMAVGSVVTDETLVGGTLTREFSERYNEFLAFQIIETITVDDAALLDLPSFTTSIENLIPQIFRAQIPTHVVSHIVEGVAKETRLSQSTDLLVSGGTQDGVYTDRGIVNGKRKYNLLGQPDSDDFSLLVWVDTFPSDMWAIFDDNGNPVYYSLSDVATPDLATNWLNASDDMAASITVTKPFGAEFEHSERQLTPLYKEVRSTVLDDIGSLPITITGMKETNAQKQVVSVAMKLCVDSTTPTVPTALIDVDFKKLGNGLAIEITKTIAEVFDPAFYEARRPEFVPERFIAGVDAITAKHVVTGTASQPSLGTGDLYRSQRQIDVFTYELTITNRSIGSFPTLSGQTYDEQLDTVIPYTESIASAGSSIGTDEVEVIPIGGGLEIVKVYDLTAVKAAMDAYSCSFRGSASVALPAVLTSLDTVVETAVGEGDDGLDFYGFGYWTGGGAWSLRYDASSNGSAAIVPDIIEGIEQPWAHNKDTTHYLLFAPIAGVDAVVSGLGDTWPNWHPKSVTIVATSRKVSLQTKASVSISSGGNSSNNDGSEHSSTGASREVNVSVKTIRIPPTIHGSFSLSLGTTTQDVTVHSFAELFTDDPGLTGDMAADRSETDTATASISPTTISATPGSTDIPSGDYIFNVDCSPYRFGYVRVHVEVIHL